MCGTNERGVSCGLRLQSGDNQGTPYLVNVSNYWTLKRALANGIVLDLRDGSGQTEYDNLGRPKAWRHMNTNDSPESLSVGFEYGYDRGGNATASPSARPQTMEHAHKEEISMVSPDTAIENIDNWEDAILDGQGPLTDETEIPIPSACAIVENWIMENQCSSSQDIRAWGRFISGSERDIELDENEVLSIAFLNRHFLEYLRGIQTKCFSGEREWSKRSENVGADYIEHPWQLAIGQTSVIVESECTNRCLKWKATVNDPFDFNVTWFQGRDPLGEAKVMAVNIADFVLACGWKEFAHRGSYESRMSYDSSEGLWAH